MLSLGDWEGRVVVSSEVRKAREELVGHKEEPLPEEKPLGLESENPSSHSPLALYQL